MRKRTGSIDITPDGHYRVRLTLPGRQRRTLGVFETEEEAFLERSAALSVLKDEGPDDGQTLANWGDKCLSRREVGGDIRDPQSDWGRWRTHVLPHAIAGRSLRSLRRRDIVEWVDVVRRKVATQTARNTLNLLRQILAMAVEAETIKANPAAGISVQTKKRTEDPWTYATPEEQAALVAAFDALPSGKSAERWIVQFAFGTGLRAGELCALRLRDVHATGPKPHIIVRYGTPPDLPTKSGKIRRVPLFGPGLEAARAWRQALPAYCRSNPNGLLFPRAGGAFRDEAHVLPWKVWKGGLDAKGVFVPGVQELAGISRTFRWHDLRHTCASSLVSGWWGRTWSLQEVKEMLGHASITTTERYAHLAGTVLERAAAATQRVSRRSDRTQVRETPLETNDFVNRRSRVQISKAAPCNSGELDAPDETHQDRLVAVCLSLLRAVVEGNGEAAQSLSAELANGVLGSPDVVLARSVLEGGPLAITRAIQLAELLATATESRPAECAS